MGDHQSLVASLRQSTYYPLFKDEVAAWEGKLSLLQVLCLPGRRPRLLPAALKLEGSVVYYTLCAAA